MKNKDRELGIGEFQGFVKKAIRVDPQMVEKFPEKKDLDAVAKKYYRKT